MIVSRKIKVGNLIKWSGKHILWLIAYSSIVALLYYYNVIDVPIPWIPVSVIGTAVAFYVGFKNNQSYDRLWEARKIWGGIVNESRSWGMMVDAYVSNIFMDSKLPDSELHAIKKRLIYRHIGWLYAHRSQLLVAKSWEHIGQSGTEKKEAEYYQKKFGVGLIDDNSTRRNLENFIPKNEYEELVNSVNTATQIINKQSRDLQTLRQKNLIDDFRNNQMEDVLRSFYTLQGKNERIKNFPLPRQYANMSRYFTGIFIFLVPFSLVPTLMESGEFAFFLSVPLTVVIGWVYVVMELVGDYSENPFSGMANDIPMLSLCRTIEIDLRQMLGETELPPPIHANEGILM